MDTTSRSLQSIPEFFAGRSIFISGGTGFIGKVLIEKLLRSCPDLDTIYILVRPKKGQDIQQRTKDITKFPLFDKLRKEQPSVLNKLHGISGDVMDLELGISPQDRQLLQDKVSVVFHVAATVRFDETFTKAVLTNVRGTHEMMQLASGMKHLKVLLHTSTAFTNTHLKVIEEKLYEIPMDWRAVIHLAESGDQFTIRLLTNKIVGNRPNTYTFTKALAEQVVSEYRKQLPVIIFRPSIVGPTVSEPIPGWLDNFYGPNGLMIGAGKGVVHTAYCDENVRGDMVPVDTACKGLIVASWFEAQKRTSSMPVYNGTFSGIEDFSIRNINKIGSKILDEIPLNNGIYYHCNYSTNNYVVFCLLFFLLQLFPSMLLDSILWFNGRKTMLVRLQRRIFITFHVIRYFVAHSWDQRTSKFRDLEKNLLPEDYVAFNYGFSEKSDITSYLKGCTLGVRRYLFHEDDKSIPAARKHSQRLYLLHLFIMALAYSSVLWFGYRHSIPQKLFSSFFCIVRSLLIL